MTLGAAAMSSTQPNMALPPSRATAGAPTLVEDDLVVRDSDRDALHVLPLSIVPFETPAIRRARMIKDVRLNSVVEMFEDATTGSGLMEIEDVRRELRWPMDSDCTDLVLLRRLALLPTYDVYSLRILLRAEGIPVNDEEFLRLSDSTRNQLTDYMAQFTRPLLSEVYGQTNDDIKTFDDVLALFRDPDIARARRNLVAMADKLGITPPEIPRFLEDYADVFLSLSYFKRCLDDIAPTIGQVLASFDDIRGNFQLRNDRGLLAACKLVESTMNDMLAATTGRFESFDRASQEMWKNLSAERFERVKQLIRGYHTTIGGTLCALTVKMKGWTRVFPSPDAGGPMKRAEFIMSELKQGIDKIQTIEDSAPALSSLE